MKKGSLIWLLILISVGAAWAQQQTPVNKAPVHRIVMQLSSNDTLVWKGLMNNLKHLTAGWKDNVQVEVVAHGMGVELFMSQKTTQLQKIAEFKKMGISFVVCENTLREKNLTKDLFIPEAAFVPMGIGEIVMKQEQGWSYIKAGF